MRGNPLISLMKVDWNSRSMQTFDWALAFLSLAIFLWTWSWPWLAAFVVGSAFAWYRPMSRVQSFVLGMVRSRRA